jgi:hypothetical protein
MSTLIGPDRLSLMIFAAALAGSNYGVYCLGLRLLHDDSNVFLNLSSKRQDPRFGMQNFEVSDIVLGEPEAKIFELPSGFKVIDLRRATTTSSSSPQSPN